MSDFFDMETSTAFTGSPEDTAVAFQEGKAGLKPGSTVKVVSPVNGEIVEVKAEGLQRALDVGFTLPTAEAEQHHDRVQAQDTALGAIGTVVFEATNTLTLGAQDILAAQAFGEEYTQWRSAQREARPTLATATQIGTEVAVALGTAGGSLLGRGAVKATGGMAARVLARSPAAVVTRAAVSAEKAAATGLARAGMRSKTIELATGAAVENAFFEAGREASAVAIDNTERSGVEILAAIGNAAGNGAMVGGVAGGVIGMFAGGAQLAKARRLKAKDGSVIDAVNGAEGEKLGGIGEVAFRRGEEFAKQDPTLSETAHQMLDGNDIKRTQQEIWDDGADWARDGEPKRAAIATDLEQNLPKMAKQNDELLQKVEVQEKVEVVYKEAMAEAPAAPLETIQREVGNTFNQLIDSVRGAGVRVQRVAGKAKGRAKIGDLKKDLKRHQGAFEGTRRKIAAKEKQLARTRERAVTTQRASKTRGIEADLRALRDDEVALGKQLTRTEKELAKFRGIDATPVRSELQVTGFDKGRVPPGARGSMREMIDIVATYERKIGNAKTQAEAMRWLDEANRRIGSVGAGSRSPSASAIAETAYETVRQQLINPTIFGGAARAHEPIAAAWAELYRTAKNIDVIADLGKGDRAISGFRSLPLANSKKIQAFVNEAGRQVNSTKEKLLLDYLNAVQKNMQVQGQFTKEITAEQLEAGIKSVEAVRENILSAIRGKADSARFINGLQMFQQSTGLSNAVQAGLNEGALVPAPIAFGAGSALGVLGGAGAGAGVAAGGAVFGLGTAVKNLPGIAAKMSKTRAGQSMLGLTRSKGQDAVEDGIGGFIHAIKTGRVGAGAGVVAARSRRAIPRAARGVARNEDEDRYAYAIRTTQAYSTDPQTAITNLVNRLGTMPEDTPAAAASLVATAQKGAQFLVTKLPVIPPPPTFGKDDEIKRIETAPVSEKLKYMRYYDTVNDPVGFFKGLRAGEVTRESVEAMREVYPQLHQAMVGEITAALGDTKLSRPTQVFLSTALGFPAERTLDGGFIATVQKNIAAVNEEAEQRSNKTVSPSRANPPSRDFAEANATRSQQIAGNAR